MRRPAAPAGARRADLPRPAARVEGPLRAKPAAAIVDEHRHRRDVVVADDEVGRPVGVHASSQREERPLVDAGGRGRRAWPLPNNTEALFPLLFDVATSRKPSRFTSASASPWL